MKFNYFKSSMVRALSSIAVGLLRPRQPWHGDRIAVLARNEPDEECVACEEPERWRLLAPVYGACESIPFCDECRPEARRYQLVRAIAFQSSLKMWLKLVRR